MNDGTGILTEYATSYFIESSSGCLHVLWLRLLMLFKLTTVMVPQFSPDHKETKLDISSYHRFTAEGA